MSASNPEDWTTDDVVAWLKSMHFERDVWKKFKAQEITGEALFTLDVESLKSEVNIKKYGTRVRIVNAIHELLVHAAALARQSSDAKESTRDSYTTIESDGPILAGPNGSSVFSGRHYPVAPSATFGERQFPGRTSDTSVSMIQSFSSGDEYSASEGERDSTYPPPSEEFSDIRQPEFPLPHVATFGRTISSRPTPRAVIEPSRATDGPRESSGPTDDARESAPPDLGTREFHGGPECLSPISDHTEPASGQSPVPDTVATPEGGQLFSLKHKLVTLRSATARQGSRSHVKSPVSPTSRGSGSRSAH